MKRYQSPARPLVSAALAILATTVTLWIAVVAPAHPDSGTARLLARNTTVEAPGPAVVYWRVDVVGVRGDDSA